MLVGSVIVNKYALIKKDMKKLLLLLPILLSLPLLGQVIIGTGKTVLTNSSVSLEFGNEPKGLVLPWVSSKEDVVNPEPGTIIFDVKDKKVKVKLLSSWKDLTVDNSGFVSTVMQDNLLENKNAKVSIGTPTSVSGILVLEDTDKAMILPTVNSYKDIMNPAPGMMVFDVSKKMLCLFNGTVWSFWNG